jgi:hypothetical protein
MMCISCGLHRGACKLRNHISQTLTSKRVSAKNVIECRGTLFPKLTHSFAIAAKECSRRVKFLYVAGIVFGGVNNW